MVTILATANPGLQNNSPSITLPASIPDGTPGYILVHCTQANVPVDMPGWTIKDGPRQAGNNVALSYLFQKTLNASDSGTTVTGTITTTGSPRWATMAIAAVDAVEDAITFSTDSTADTTVDIPAFGTNSANVTAVTMGAATVTSGLGHATWTPQTGYTEVIDTGSSYGTLNEVNVFASRRLLTNTAGSTQAAATSAMTQAVRANVWVVTFRTPTTTPQAIHVGGSATQSSTTSTATPSLVFPTGKQAGDVGVLSAAWNPQTNPTAPTFTGWTMVGTVRTAANSLAVATWQRTLTSGDTSVAGTFGVAARGGFTLDVWRNATVFGVAYAEEATSTTQTNPVAAVTGLTGPAVYTTSWFERSGVDTAVSVPAGTTLVGSVQPVGAGSIQAAVAFNATSDTDGSVGAGVWARGNISPAADAATSSVTVAMLVGTGVATTGTGRSRWNGTVWVAQNTSRL